MQPCIPTYQIFEAAIGRSIGRCNRGSIARQAVGDGKICVRIVKLLGKKMEKEKRMCLLIQF